MLACVCLSVYESITPFFNFLITLELIVLILRYVCCIQTVIDLCISSVLTTFNKDDDDD